ncbi:hypothetical protein ANN_11651 [Periplaneta americana]|uniref:Uncharacterized protein n=1 Tax=Periplaneta americana TaxID=6978 RepID=A0ABQ8T5L9_PERAM|nr:hypothetical protein ANN_11651 [Periplaneta americana]
MAGLCEGGNESPGSLKAWIQNWREGVESMGKTLVPVHSPPVLNDVSVARTQSQKTLNINPLPYQVNDAGMEGRAHEGPRPTSRLLALRPHAEAEVSNQNGGVVWLAR